MGERLVRNEEVRGSIPLSSTISLRFVNLTYRITNGSAIGCRDRLNHTDFVRV
jgi:hypothetical protein